MEAEGTSETLDHSANINVSYSRTLYSQISLLSSAQILIRGLFNDVISHSHSLTTRLGYSSTHAVSQ